VRKPKAGGRRNADEHRHGIADDVTDADGVAILDFRQAQEKARAWFAEHARRAEGLEPSPTGPYTVADAMRDYLDWYGKRRKSLKATEFASNGHIVQALGTLETRKLTATRISEWHEALASAPVRLRSRKGQPVRHAKTPANADSRRRRQATANRVLTILKAALNHAWHDGKVASDDARRRVRPFHDVDAPVVRYLTGNEAVRVVNACEPDFRQMVRAALLTGCRYGELAALMAGDLNPDSGTLSVRTSKSGKPRHVVLTEEAQKFFASATAGKANGDLILTRANGTAWGRSYQQRPLKDACKRAKIAPAINFHILRHTHGSLLAMQGVPMPVIAKQLGHADTRMTERHYAHLSPSYVADTIRENFPKLGIIGKGKVLPLAQRKGS
jgi:integrase